MIFMDNPQLTDKKTGNYLAAIISLESGTIRLRCASDGHLDHLRTPQTGVSHGSRLLQSIRRFFFHTMIKRTLQSLCLIIAIG
jgi:hypothetical protein